MSATASAANNLQPQTGPFTMQRGSPIPWGATPFRLGVNFAVFSKYATSCTLVLIDPVTHKTLAELPFDPQLNRTGQMWHAFVENADTGMHYGYRFDMQPNPDPTVYRFNPAIVLIDPCVRVISG